MMNKLKYILYITLAAATLTVAFFIGRSTLKDDLYYSRQNLKALSDSINIVKMSNDELLYNQSVFYTEKQYLNDLIGIKDKEIKEIESKLNTALTYISNIESNIKIDTVYIDNIEEERDSTGIYIKLIHTDKWFNFKGELKLDTIYNPINFNLYDINIPTNIQVGLTSDNKMFIKSENPYLEFSNIKGSYIIENAVNTPKPKWSHGIGIGFGFQYGIINKSIDIGPQVGYTITYNF